MQAKIVQSCTFPKTQAMFVQMTSAVKQDFGKGRITGSKKYKNCSGFLPSFSLL